MEGRNVGGCQATRILWRKIGFGRGTRRDLDSLSYISYNSAWLRLTSPCRFPRLCTRCLRDFSSYATPSYMQNMINDVIERLASSFDRRLNRQRRKSVDPGCFDRNLDVNLLWDHHVVVRLQESARTKAADERTSATLRSCSVLSCFSSGLRRLQHLLVFVAACKNPQAHVFAY